MHDPWQPPSCPRVMQLLHELYTKQESTMSDDDKAFEARVEAEIGPYF